MNRNQAGFSPDHHEVRFQVAPVSATDVRDWFADSAALEHYTRATLSVGLWRSEVAVFNQVLARDGLILDVGCGTGRIALGLWQLGFRSIRGLDFCPAMVRRAQELAVAASADVHFEVADATRLPFPDASIAGAIFGFNGLMQIPGRDFRKAALAEIRRVVRRGGRFVFTTHDRSFPWERSAWDSERRLWQTQGQDPRLREYGDRILFRPEGTIFMHLPDREEVLADLAQTGWTHEFDERRSRLANEPLAVREFADECRFWVAANR